MRLIYNGVDLGVLETYEFDVSPVYDDTGTDYLYSRVSFVGRCLVNGTATVTPAETGWPANGPFLGYRRTGQASQGGNPTPPARGYVGEPVRENTTFPNLGIVPGAPANATDATNAAAPSRLVSIARTPVPPATTYEAVLHRLSVPRAQLWVFAGSDSATAPLAGDATVPLARDQVFVRSPGVDQLVDCKNGPKPKVLACHTALGDATTLMVDYAIETYINESAVNGVSYPGALLSNRFAQTQVVGEDGWTSVVTAGAAIFRTDFLYRVVGGQRQFRGPDDFRPLLFMPIPPGFKRENIEVAGLPDVTGVRYSYADVQQPVSFPAGPYARAASITALHRQAIVSDTDIVEGVLSSYERFLNLKWLKKTGNEGRPPKGKPFPTLPQPDPGP